MMPFRILRSRVLAESLPKTRRPRAARLRGLLFLCTPSPSLSGGKSRSGVLGPKCLRIWR